MSETAPAWAQGAPAAPSWAVASPTPELDAEQSVEAAGVPAWARVRPRFTPFASPEAAAEEPIPTFSGPSAAPRVEAAVRATTPDPGTMPTMPEGGARAYQQGVEVNPTPGGTRPTFIPEGGVATPGQDFLGALGSEVGRGVSDWASYGAGALRAAQGVGEAIRTNPSIPSAEPHARAAWEAQRAQGEAPPGGAKPSWAEASLGAAADALDRLGAAGAAAAPVNPVWERNPITAPVMAAARMATGSGPMVVGAILGGLPAAGAAAFSQAYGGTFNAATAKGAPPSVAHGAALANGMLNAGLIAAPAARWVSALPTWVKQPVLNWATDVALNAGTMVGFGQAQQLADNVVARATYDPKRPMMQGLGQGVAGQALAGAVIGAAVPRPEPEPVEPGAAAAATKPAGAPHPAPVTPAMAPADALATLEREGGVPEAPAGMPPQTALSAVQDRGNKSRAPTPSPLDDIEQARMRIGEMPPGAQAAPAGAPEAPPALPPDVPAVPPPEPAPAPVAAPPSAPRPVKFDPASLARPGVIRTAAQIQAEDGVTAKQAAKVQEQEIIARSRAAIPKEAGAPLAAAPAPQSLSAFLIGKGGLRPHGDLEAMDARIARPGLISRNGLTLDYAREAAEEEGYLPSGSTTADLLNAVADDLQGRRVYKPEEAAQAAHQAQGPQQAQYEASLQTVRHVAETAGLPANDADLHYAAVAMVDRGIAPERALLDSMYSNQMEVFHPEDEGQPYNELFEPRVPKGAAGSPGQPDLFGRTSREGAVRAAPLDQLALPGTEGSAVQAQAARDQAGRGALLPSGPQAPANEGLFAPKGPDQLTLGADRLTRGAPVFDRAADFGAFSPEVEMAERAAQYVLTRGRETGHEHAVLFDAPTGRVVDASTTGEAGRVQLGQAASDYARNSANRGVLVHNHPEGSPPSLEDLRPLFTAPGIKAVAAGGHDGSVYSVTRGPEPVGFSDIERHFDAALGAAKRATEGSIPSLGPRAVEVIRQDATLSALHSAGYINYRSSLVLPEAGAAVWQGAAAAARGAIRDADSPNRPAEQPLPMESFRGHAGELGQRVGGFPPRSGSSPGEAAPGARGEGEAGHGAAPSTEGPVTLREDADRKRPGLNALARATQRGLGLEPRAGPSLGAQLVDEVQSLLAPTAREGAKPMERIVRARAAMLQRSSDQTMHALDEFRRQVGRLPVEEQLDITHRAERGQPQSTPELDRVMGAVRQEQAKWRGLVQGLGRGYLRNAIEDYMGRLYSNYREWVAGQPAPDEALAQGRARAAAMAKSPLRGSGAFLRPRSFDTLREAMDAGLVPVTTNPIEMQMLKAMELQKFYHGTRMGDEIKKSGMARWVPQHMEGEAAASGLARLNDRVFQPELRDDQYGWRHVGGWWAPEPAATIFNRYMDWSAMGNSRLYRGARALNAALNMAQLGLSGYHATFVAVDSMTSRLALGLQQVSRGDIWRGLGNTGMSLSPTTVATTLAFGKAIRDAWLDPANATPEMAKIANAMALGGGRIRMQRIYQASGAGSFIKGIADLKNPKGVFRDAWDGVKGTPLTAPMRLAGRLLDTINEPLMGQMVPLMKLGVFGHLAQDWMRRNPEASLDETSDAMTKFWDSVDNRMGQLVYDNLFWSKALKDTAFLTTRSVGWNTGSVRELGGGGVDAAAQVGRMARGRAPELTTRMAYTIAMPIMTAWIGAVVTYLTTGVGPQQMLDYFYPPDGHGGRLSIPGYMKDVVAFSKNPVQTALNKQSPLLETATELAQNRDYYGASIYDKTHDDPLVAYPEYLLNQVIPFSWRGMLREQEQGASMLSQALSFWGFQPAPKSVTSPGGEERWSERQAKAAYRKRLREPGRLSFGQ